MLLYDMGDPIRAVEILGPDIASVHVKDAIRPTTPGDWGEEVPLGQGAVNMPLFVETLKKVGYAGRCASSARSATRRSGWPTARTGSASCATSSRGRHGLRRGLRSHP